MTAEPTVDSRLASVLKDLSGEHPWIAGVKEIPGFQKFLVDCVSLVAERPEVLERDDLRVGLVHEFYVYLPKYWVDKGDDHYGTVANKLTDAFWLLPEAMRAGTAERVQQEFGPLMRRKVFIADRSSVPDPTPWEVAPDYDLKGESRGA